MKNARKLISLVIAGAFLLNALLLPEAFVFADQGVPAVSENTVQNPDSQKVNNPEIAKSEADRNAISNQNVASDLNGAGNIQITKDNLEKVSTKTQKDKKAKEKKKLLVKFKDDSKAEATKDSVKNKTKSKKLTFIKKNKKTKAELLQVEDEDDVRDVISELKKDSNVEYAQQDFKITAFETVSDERFPEEWGIQNSGQAVNGQAGTTGVDIGASKVWSAIPNPNSTVVGVLDSGIDINHSDLKDNIYINSKEIPNNGIDDDNNGYIDDVNGYDFINNDSSVYDSPEADLHGTHVAGIIAGLKNGTGIVGTAPNVKVLPLKFIDGTTGYTSDVIEAIQYASDMGVKIINCSFGGSEYNPALKDSMEQSGALFICAAGNTGVDLAVQPMYPASFGISNIVTVGAVDNNGNYASFSNYGNNVDIAAPGVNILSTAPGNSYRYMSGTSMAAPFVTGIAALVNQIKPEVAGLDLQKLVANSVKVSDKLIGKVRTAGIANALSATGIADNSSSTAEVQRPPLPTDIEQRRAEMSKNNPPSTDVNKVDISDVFNITSKYKNDKVVATFDYIKEIKDNEAVKLNIQEKGTKNVVSYEVAKANTKDKTIKIEDLKADTEYTFEVVVDNSKIVYKYLGELQFPSETVKQKNSDTEQDINTGITSLYLTPQSVSEKAIAMGDKAVIETLATIYEYESNDSMSLADESASDNDMYGVIGNSTDVDWYKTYFSQSGTANFWLGSVPADKDYDIRLYNASGTELGSSTGGTGSDEQIAGYAVNANSWYYVKVYGYNSGYNASSYYHFRAKQVTFNAADTTAPTVTGLALTPNVAYSSASSYRVELAASDASGIGWVGFATWRDYEGSGNCQWTTGTYDSSTGKYYANIYPSNFGNYNGKYKNSICVQDYTPASNSTYADLPDFNYDSVAPSITSVSTSPTGPNITGTSYTINAVVTDNYSGIAQVNFAVWTTSGGQNDLVSQSGTYIGSNTWQYVVNSSAHNYETGQYEATVTAYDNAWTQRSYTAPTVTLTQNDDFGNDMASASTISIGGTKSGNINYGGDVDFFKFTATTTGTYTIGSTGSTDTYGHLLNSSGTELLSNDDSNGTANFTINYALTAGQLYYVKVRHYNVTTGTGAYTLYVNAPSTQVDDYGNDMASAYSMSVGATVSGNINYAGDIDFFKFTAPASSKFLISTTGATDTYGHLMNSSGTELTYNDDFNGSTNFAIYYNLIAGQVYYVKVRHYSTSSTGAYVLSVVQVDNYESNESMGMAKDIATNTSIFATIHSSIDKDYYKFTIPSQMEVGVRLISPTGRDYNAIVYDTNGTQITALDMLSDLQAERRLTVLQPGTYYIYVYGYNNSYSNIIYGLNVAVGDFQPGDNEVFLDDLLNETKAYKEGTSLILDVDGVLRRWDNYNFRLVAGREVVNIISFYNALLPESVINNRIIALNDFTGGGYYYCDISGINTAVYQSSGDNVVKIQKALKSANSWIDAPNGTVSNYTATGFYGATTRASLIKFQLDVMNLSLSEIFLSGHVPANRNYIYTDNVAKYHVGCGPRTAQALSNYLNGDAGPSVISIVSPIWKSTDANYSDMVQSLLLELNFNWYFASTETERNSIVAKANEVRQNSNAGVGWWLDQSKQVTEAAANEFSWFLGGSTSTVTRDEWLEMNQWFQSDLQVNDSGSLEGGMFIAGIVSPSGMFKNGLKSFIKHGTYNELRNTLGEVGVEKFIKAMKKGIVGAVGENGIKELPNGYKSGMKTYFYEIKVLAKNTSHYRILGNYDPKTGHIMFEKIIND